MTIPQVDRRKHERFDVVGGLWGVLEVPETAAIVNTNETGLLLKTSACPALDAVHNADVSLGGTTTPVKSVVRHARPIEDGMFLVGVEILSHLGVQSSAPTRLGPGAGVAAESASIGTRS